MKARWACNMIHFPLSVSVTVSMFMSAASCHSRDQSTPGANLAAGRWKG
ncbi:hypothetical protein ABZ990_25900 [Streptomyces sp. NPDC046203]